MQESLASIPVIFLTLSSKKTKGEVVEMRWMEARRALSIAAGSDLLLDLGLASGLVVSLPFP